MKKRKSGILRKWMKDIHQSHSKRAWMYEENECGRHCYLIKVLQEGKWLER